MKNQLNRGFQRRLMYIENKDGEIDGVSARIGWVTFSKSGLSVYYRGKTLKRSRRSGIRGNHYCVDTGEEYWVSGVKKRGSNNHIHKPVDVYIDGDAMQAYRELITGEA